MARCIRLLRGDNFISALWTDLLLTLPGKSRTASFIPLIALSHLVMLATLTAFVVPLRLPLTCSLIVLWIRAYLVGFNLSCFYPVSCFVVSCPFWFLFLWALCGPSCLCLFAESGQVLFVDSSKRPSFSLCLSWSCPFDGGHKGES